VASFPLSYYLAVRESYLLEMGILKPAKPKSDLPFTVEGEPLD
jgi:hypothetical protein